MILMLCVCNYKGEPRNILNIYLICIFSAIWLNLALSNNDEIEVDLFSVSLPYTIIPWKRQCDVGFHWYRTIWQTLMSRPAPSIFLDTLLFRCLGLASLVCGDLTLMTMDTSKKNSVVSWNCFYWLTDLKF
jgi:hypothetical protein